MVVSCGTDSAPEAEEEAGVETTATSTQQQETATTTEATTTTTLPPDPEEVLLAEVAARGIGQMIEADNLMGLAEQVCTYTADQADPANGIYAEAITNIFFAGSADRGELTALFIETVCPENSSLLELSADQWAQARTHVWDIGDCFFETAGFARIPSDCAEPHNGEVVGFIDTEGLEFPTPETSSEFYEQIDCRTPIVDYLGGEATTLGYSTGLVASSVEEWDEGETRVMCSASSRARLLQGSVQGAAAEIEAAASAVNFTISVCTPETFEATITNTGDTDTGVHVSFSNYYPTGAAFDVTEPLVGAGETVTISTTFEDPDPNVPADCERHFVSAVPVPIGG